MIEDADLNRVLKGALEANGSFTLRPRGRRFPAVNWRMLSAASVAVVMSFALWLRPVEDQGLKAAIALMAEVDGVELETGASSAEWLAAWQDSPCEQGL